MTEFNTKTLEEGLTAETATRADAQILLEQALQPFNEIEDRRERLLDTLAFAITEDLIHRVQDTDELQGNLPNISDVKDEVKTLIENKIAPKVQQGDKEKAEERKGGWQDSPQELSRGYHNTRGAIGQHQDR